MIKKLFTLTLTLITAFAVVLALPQPAFATDYYEDGDFKYCLGVVDEGLTRAIVTGFSTAGKEKNPKSITIPTIADITYFELTDWDVKAINNIAFENNTVIEEVIVPGEIYLIGGSAFSGCTSLKSITLNEGLYRIESNVFYDCKNLTEITIPKSVEEMGEGVFSGYNGTIKVYYNSYAHNFCKDKNISNFTVIDPPVEIRWSADTEFTYDGTEKSVTAQIKNKLNENDDVQPVLSGNNATNAGKYTAQVTDFTGKDAGKYTLERTENSKIDWEIKKATAAVTDIRDLNKTYDGNAVQNPGYNYNGDGTVTIKWYVDDAGAIGNEIAESPKNAGKYWVGISAAEGANYTAIAQQTKQFEITKAVPAYTTPANLTATYGQILADVKLPPEFTWQDDVAKHVGNAGTNQFKVKYTPADTDNYTIVENIDVTVEVAKATPEPVVPNPFVITCPRTLMDITLPGDGAGKWEWNGGQIAIIGTHDYDLTYKPYDTENFNDVPATVKVTLNKANPSYTLPAGLTVTIGKTLKDIPLPTDTNGTWAWEDETIKADKLGKTNTNLNLHQMIQPITTFSQALKLMWK